MRVRVWSAFLKIELEIFKRNGWYPGMTDHVSCICNFYTTDNHLADRCAWAVDDSVMLTFYCKKVQSDSTCAQSHMLPCSLLVLQGFHAFSSFCLSSMFSELRSFIFLQGLKMVFAPFPCMRNFKWRFRERAHCQTESTSDKLQLPFPAPDLNSLIAEAWFLT